MIGASVSPWCLLTLIDYPFVLYWYRLRNKGKKGMLDELAKCWPEKFHFKNVWKEKKFMLSLIKSALHIHCGNLCVVLLWIESTESSLSSAGKPH